MIAMDTRTSSNAKPPVPRVNGRCRHRGHRGEWESFVKCTHSVAILAICKVQAACHSLNARQSSSSSLSNTPMHAQTSPEARALHPAGGSFFAAAGTVSAAPDASGQERSSGGEMEADSWPERPALFVPCSCRSLFRCSAVISAARCRPSAGHSGWEMMLTALR
jgi:hypothetical protein